DLVAPAPSAGVGIGWAPTFSWSSAALADDYRLLVDDDPYFRSPAIDVTVAGSSYAGGTLTDGKVYFWTVQARNAGGITAPWCEPIGAFHTGTAVPAVLYVDDGAPAGGDGAAWGTAFNDLQDALALAACAGGATVEVRVGQGTYKPDRDSGDRAASFVLCS